MLFELLFVQQSFNKIKHLRAKKNIKKIPSREALKLK